MSRKMGRTKGPYTKKGRPKKIKRRGIPKPRKKPGPKPGSKPKLKKVKRWKIRKGVMSRYGVGIESMIVATKEAYFMVNDENKKYARMFLQELQLEELKPNTIKRYMGVVKYFMVYLKAYKEDMCVLDVTLRDIYEYYAWYCNKKHQLKSYGTTKTSVVSLNRFYNYLERRMFVEISPMRGFVKPNGKMINPKKPDKIVIKRHEY